ncbi:uncharacterized protein LOC142972746 [Anticarsia gemmatalis]|uniref:uncharacterized protein LOC142972746 n=1 Tax=Anticarsia gemmatalis TaxID=129554 RepID=UPI003F762E9A
MACKIALFTTALFLLIALSLSAPAEEKPSENLAAPQNDDLATEDKGDLKTAASHWGGYGGHWGGYIGSYGHYPGYYGHWGWPSYGYGYGYGWPYGGYGGYGHGGYWW